MNKEPRGSQAARLRQRKFRLLGRFPIPSDLLPGALTRSFTRCGNPRCHCAQDQGHEAWTLTFMSQGRRRVERIPREWVQEVEQRVVAGHQFQDAVREVLAANAELLVLASQHLHLAAYFRSSGDGRKSHRIPAKDLLWSILLGIILRQWAFLAIEALVGSKARRNLQVSRRFGDDALGYFTARLDPQPTRAALAAVLRRAKRNKAFEDCRFVGLALDGTTGGRRRKKGCPLCRPYRNAKKEILGYRHHFALAAVVGGDLVLPVDVEPYGPGDSEYAAGQRLLHRVRENLGARLIDYVVVDGEFATAPFLHAAGKAGWPVVARLKENLPELSKAAERRFRSQPPDLEFRDGTDRVQIWDD